MKTINTLMYFFIVIIMLTATVALYVLGWVVYPILWICSRCARRDRYKLRKGYVADLRRRAREIVRIVKQNKTK
jgi:hypothetical protein